MTEIFAKTFFKNKTFSIVFVISKIYNIFGHYILFSRAGGGGGEQQQQWRAVASPAPRVLGGAHCLASPRHSDCSVHPAGVLDDTVEWCLDELTRGIEWYTF